MRSSALSSEAPPRLLTTTAAARVAHCDRSTLLRAIYRGELEALRLGGRGSYRIRPAALEKFLRPTSTEDPAEGNDRQVPR